MFVSLPPKLGESKFVQLTMSMDEALCLRKEFTDRAKRVTGLAVAGQCYRFSRLLPPASLPERHRNRYHFAMVNAEGIEGYCHAQPDVDGGLEWLVLTKARTVYLMQDHAEKRLASLRGRDLGRTNRAKVLQEFARVEWSPYAKGLLKETKAYLPA